MLNFPTAKLARQPKKTVFKNISDEIKTNAETFLLQICESSNKFQDFTQFVKMIEDKEVPVDIRHGKSSKTELMMAVWHGDEGWVKKLMGLKANAVQTHKRISMKWQFAMKESCRF